jgi:hypothetical protein
MATWNYPGPNGRQQRSQACRKPRWNKPEWKSLAWAVQLLVALDGFFVLMTKSPILSDVCWWLALISTGLVLVLVSVLAVR